MTALTNLARACGGLLLAASSCLAANSPDDGSWETSRTASMIPASQPYANEQYGFVMPAIAGARAYQDKAPNPNHGVILVLGDRRVITVAAEYDAARLGTAKAYLDLLLQADHNHGHPIVRPTRSAGHAAWSATIRQPDSLRKFVAIRRGEAGGINYALTLETTASAAIEDSNTFGRVARDLKFVALPR